jgi:hypothetical protein
VQNIIIELFRTEVSEQQPLKTAKCGALKPVGFLARLVQ